MQSFLDLYNLLDSPARSEDKAEALERYFATASAADTAWARQLLSGARIPRAVSPQTLRIWAQEESGLPAWLIEEAYSAGGDLSETLALLFDDSPSEQSLTFAQWIQEKVLALAEMPADRKSALVRSTWRHSSTTERVLFNKLISGSFRSPATRLLSNKATLDKSQIEAPVPAEIPTETYSTLAVLLYVQIARGTQPPEYTFGIKGDGDFVPIIKIAGSLDGPTKRIVDRHVRSSTIQQFGPVRTVTAKLVFEISFDSISASSRHKSGITVQNPTILGFYPEKSLDEIGNLDDLKRTFKL